MDLANGFGEWIDRLKKQTFRLVLTRCTRGSKATEADGEEVGELWPAGIRRQGGAGLVEQGAWTNRQRQYGKAFKKPTSQRSSAEKTYAGKTTERRVALLDGIGFFT